MQTLYEALKYKIIEYQVKQKPLVALYSHISIHNFTTIIFLFNFPFQPHHKFNACPTTFYQNDISPSENLPNLTSDKVSKRIGIHQSIIHQHTKLLIVIYYFLWTYFLWAVVKSIMLLFIYIIFGYKCGLWININFPVDKKFIFCM